MKHLFALFALISLSAFAFAGGEDDGHAHGPDGRHVVTAEAPKAAGSFMQSHHEMRIEDAEGNVIQDAEVLSTIAPTARPENIIHTEKNVYEPENEVYGTHLSYTEPGDYILTQNVKLPSGKEMVVKFPILVPSVATSAPAQEHAHGPNYLLIVGGIVGAILLLVATYRMGKRSATGTVSGLMIAALLASAIPNLASASEEDDGHMHGPDGRHIVTEAPSRAAMGPQLKAYATPEEGKPAIQTIDGIKFTLSIKNEVVEPDPNLIMIAEEQATIIGLQTGTAELSSSAAGLQANGKVSANPNGIVKVNARAGGRIIRLGALPGTEVKRGQVLATIESPDLAAAQSAWRTANAELAQAQAGVRIATSSIDAARTEQGIAERELSRQRSLATAGEFSSPSVEAARKADSEARSNLDALNAEVARLTALLARQRQGLASGIVAQREVDLTEAAITAAKAELANAVVQKRVSGEILTREESIARQGLRNAKEVDAALARLDLAKSMVRSAQSQHARALADVARVRSAIRVAGDQVRLLGGQPGGGNLISLSSPIDAEVEHRFVTVGQTVATGEILYDLLNADLVWVMAEVYERDIAKVEVGQTMEVYTDAYPDRAYAGRVAFVHNEVNPETRTTQVRVVIKNANEQLKQDMFVRVVLGTDNQQLVTVPTTAVQAKEGLDYVFVQEQTGRYRRTLVQVIKTVGNRTVVKGVESGQTVATSGSYQLLSMGGGR